MEYIVVKKTRVGKIYLVGAINVIDYCISLFLIIQLIEQLICLFKQNVSLGEQLFRRIFSINSFSL